MRQRDPAERRALGALHGHLPGVYLRWADRAGRIETFEDPARACEQALGEWARTAARVGPARAVMIARDNDTRAALNDGARERLRSHGAFGEERVYNGLPVAVGDRVIARHNDRRLDVDNGTRGTVSDLDDHHVTIETDAGVVRQLPAAYVSEHLEHAYALTGHGMQGATIEAALVLASPRDLTAGWSYTALSRARGETRLLVYDREFSEERSEFAPTDHAPKAARDELLARVQRHMLVRDDEELAIEQLPDAIESLRQQVAALPTRQLQRIENLDVRAVTLETQRLRLTERLAELPETRRRLGRRQDPVAVERANLSSALRSASRELDAVMEQRDLVKHNVVDPDQSRGERDRLEREIETLTREPTGARDNREVNPMEVDLGIEL
jgi:hypothetical protein